MGYLKRYLGNSNNFFNAKTLYFLQMTKKEKEMLKLKLN